MKEQLIRIVSALTDNEAAKEKYALHLQLLLDSIDPDKIGNEYKTALLNNDAEVALGSLVKHFRVRPLNPLPGLSANGEFNVAAAERVVNGYAREVNIDWHFEGGEIDFLFDPTEIKGPRNHEWLWQFNRHGGWATLARAYVGTGDERYTAAFQRQLLKWIAQTDIPEKWNAPGSAWRTIECGIRMLGVWHIAYDGFVRSKEFNDIVLLLMIASMHKHVLHLVAHPTARNWLMMEMNGVFTVSALFDEFKSAKENRGIAAKYLLDELKIQVYPDGMHNELSPDYQFVVLSCACNFYSLAKELGLASEIPSAFTDLIKDTVNAAIKLSTPGFTQPRTNDCYTMKTEGYTARAEALFGKTDEYSFVNTKRAEGAPPKGETASVFLPYSGFVAMRNDWSADSAYMCFDVGPLGAAHVHQDKLNINIYKGNEELVFDDGGGQYEISDARRYACSGYGHNVLLVDGMAQSRKAPLINDTPIDAGWVTTPEFDYAFGEYGDEYGAEGTKPVDHKREIRFCKPDLFVIKDTITSKDGLDHDLEILFRLDTTKVNVLEQYKNSIVSDFGKKYDIVLVALDDDGAVLKTVSGATEPMMQGWYNGRNEANLHKAITVSREVKGVKQFRFTTLAIPITSGEEIPTVTKENGIITVKVGEKQYCIDLDSLNK